MSSQATEVDNTCCICLTAEDPIVFRCSGLDSHGFCQQCLSNAVRDDIPQKCPHCNVYLDHVVLGKCVTSDEKKNVEDKMLHAIERAAPGHGEETRRCQQCNLYMEVDDLNATGEFQCRHECCGAYVKPTILEIGMKLLQQAIVPVKCPQCKTPTVLEYGCLQIACETPGCNAKYCYVCEGDLGVDFDVHEGYHETHFKENPGCAKMIQEYNERDPSWPENQEAALEKLHNWQIRRNLVEIREKQGFQAAVESERGQALLAGMNMTVEEVLVMDLESLPEGMVVDDLFDLSDLPNVPEGFSQMQTALTQWHTANFEEFGRCLREGDHVRLQQLLDNDPYPNSRWLFHLAINRMNFPGDISDNCLNVLEHAGGDVNFTTADTRCISTRAVAMPNVFNWFLRHANADFVQEDMIDFLHRAAELAQFHAIVAMHEYYSHYMLDMVIDVLNNALNFVFEPDLAVIRTIFNHDNSEIERMQKLCIQKLISFDADINNLEYSLGFRVGVTPLDLASDSNFSIDFQNWLRSEFGAKTYAELQSEATNS